MVVFSLDAEGIGRRIEEILAVLAAAYRTTPDALRPGFCANAQGVGFRFVATEEADGVMVGLAYGHDLRPEDALYRVAAEHLDERARETWLDDAFQVVELAVVPSQQRRGLGVRLLNNLLAPVPHRTALIGVWGNSVARLLCERHGWQTLVPEVSLHPGHPHFTLMARDSCPPDSEIWED